MRMIVVLHSLAFRRNTHLSLPLERLEIGINLLVILIPPCIAVPSSVLFRNCVPTAAATGTTTDLTRLQAL